MDTRQLTPGEQDIITAWSLLDRDPEQGRKRLINLRRDFRLKEIAEVIGVTPKEVTAAVRPRIPDAHAGRLQHAHQKSVAARYGDEGDAARKELAALAKAYVAAGWSWADIAEVLGTSRQGAFRLSKIDVEPAAVGPIPKRIDIPIPDYAPEPTHRRIDSVPTEEVDRLRSGAVARFKRTRAAGTSADDKHDAEIALVDEALDLSNRYGVTLAVLDAAVGLTRYTIADVAVRNGYDVYFPPSRMRKVHQK